MPSIITPAKHLLKKQLQTIAARYGRHTRSPSRPELILLMYHRVLPPDDLRASAEEPGMMVTPDTFRSHMSIIKSLFEPIHLSRWLELKDKGEQLPLRSCAITFDDGWADNYEFAFPILLELEIPATIFLVSDMIGSNLKFWPERLTRILTQVAEQKPGQWSHPSLDWIKQSDSSYSFMATAPSPEQLSEIIAGVKSYGDADIHRRLDLIEDKLQLSLQDTPASLLNWQQVKTMCESGLIEVGSHTCHHTRLTANLDESQLCNEIINSKATIEKQAGITVKTFCYPNGDYCERAAAIVAQNYSGAVTTENGWNTSSSNNYKLQRIGVHEDIANDRTSFLARVSGWL